MTPSVRRRLVVVGMAVLAVGAGVSIVKGNGGGVRDAIGNTSAPWLLLPFIAVLYSRIWSTRRGVLTGLLASMTALCGFYVANAFVLNLGPHLARRHQPDGEGGANLLRPGRRQWTPDVVVVWAGEISVGLCACAATAVLLGQDSRSSRR